MFNLDHDPLHPISCGLISPCLANLSLALINLPLLDAVMALTDRVLSPSAPNPRADAGTTYVLPLRLTLANAVLVGRHEIRAWKQAILGHERRTGTVTVPESYTGSS